ncbi:MAG: undecaprenyl-diphosphate phosphatase [Patescibacteria group bacterium]|nr:undecaprenyl-diphosphate phosphatase [Patescibacteria group bacterium]
MLEKIILGAIQGVAEWLPVSSEGVLVLVQLRFFGGNGSLAEMVKFALFLHLGTFLAALIYFRRQVGKIVKTVFTYRKSSLEERGLVDFLLVSSSLTFLIGLLVLRFFSVFEEQLKLSGGILSLIIGLTLMITALLQLASKKMGSRSLDSLNLKDGFILGVVQGLAAIPGFSRSGATVSSLLLLGVEKTLALKLSFLMSLPVVFGGNILLNLNYLAFDWQLILALSSSFVFGILTIHFLIKAAEKINFGIFVMVFGIITVISSLIP